ncbi:hypothetical protein SDRG_07052 [Saprolegnia diclina VS20]|uniref:Uncharacterized protein n=1 Tax=Saprolegnia diclina (strain VS20) TaxID=1156394 RepID=T0QND5_SAPDV|nr:hypothetical protein SDRG_07052 [Saprolegnia diclina VS20]EQC35340.1 hypothetical protein SDRG_07052 [Saprolegnia diclina VS20]|eukprot:XP_008611090.1 hypothetical protein SDRG_07052 [Saprolegnia diclina VS20]
MTKRSCHASMSVVDSDVLIVIVQYLASPDDVVSLLQAVPRTKLVAPLVALQTLLTTSSAWESKNWPQLCIEMKDDRYRPLICAAAPAFPSIRIGDLHMLGSMLPGPSNSLDTQHAAIIAFAAEWGHKIESIDVTEWLDGGCIDVLTHVLHLCTGLASLTINVDTEEINPSHFAAVVHAASHARRIDVWTMDGSLSRCGDWRPIFGSWLASGHATHLGLTDAFAADDDDDDDDDDDLEDFQVKRFNDPNGFARAMTAATSLTSLRLVRCDVLLQSLLDTDASMRHITALHLDTSRRDVVEWLLSTKINLSGLRELGIGSDAQDDYSFVLALLPRLVSLEKLSLEGCALRSVPNALPESPRHLKALALSLCVAMDDSTVFRLLDWASQSPCLQSITLERCTAVGRDATRVERLVRQWIGANVRDVTFDLCEFNAATVNALAAALYGTRRALPFDLRLNCDKLRLTSFEVLLETLATCTGVTFYGHVSIYIKQHIRNHLRSLATILGLHYVDNGISHFRLRSRV